MRKIGELNNIPIVEGDPNLLKSNEILHRGGGQLSKRNNTGKIEDLGNSSGSGEGEGGGSTGGSGFEYFAFGKGTVQALAGYAQYFKIESTSMGFKAIIPYSIAMSELVAASNAEMLAIGINLSERILMKQGDALQQSTVLESLQMNGVTQEQIDAIPRITKEEFYDLEV